MQARVAETAHDATMNAGAGGCEEPEGWIKTALYSLILCAQDNGRRFLRRPFSFLMTKITPDRALLTFH
jgi:hypothetical protein